MDGTWQTAHAAASFAGIVRAKRETLQTLYYASKNSWAEALANRARLKQLPPIDALAYPTGSAKYEKHTPLLDSAMASEATAQDSAAAFIIICDYSLRRLATEGNTVDTRTLGADAYNGIKLNRAIWALANQARHLHSWQQNDWDPKSYEVLLTLDLYPTYADAPRMFIENLNLPAYVDFEERLTATAFDVLSDTGYALTATGPGIVSLVYRDASL